MNDTRRRNRSRAWVEVPAADNGEAIVAAMTEAGVEFVFFTSGSEIGFYQEAVAKASGCSLLTCSRGQKPQRAFAMPSPRCGLRWVFPLEQPTRAKVSCWR